jgi:hypothetical protein
MPFFYSEDTAAEELDRIRRKVPAEDYIGEAEFDDDDDEEDE